MISLFKKKDSSFLCSTYYPFTFKESVNFKRKFYIDSSSYKDEYLDKQNKLILTCFRDVMDVQDKLFFESLHFELFIFVFSKADFPRERSKLPSLSFENNCIFEVLEGEGFILLEDKETRKELRLYELKKYQRIIVENKFSFTIFSKNPQRPLRVLGLKSKEDEFTFGLYSSTFGPSLFYTKEGFIINKNVDLGFSLEEFFVKEQVPKDLYKELLENPKEFSQKLLSR